MEFLLFLCEYERFSYRHVFRIADNEYLSFSGNQRTSSVEDHHKQKFRLSFFTEECLKFRFRLEDIPRLADAISFPGTVTRIPMSGNGDRMLMYPFPTTGLQETLAWSVRCF